MPYYTKDSEKILFELLISHEFDFKKPNARKSFLAFQDFLHIPFEIKEIDNFEEHSDIDEYVFLDLSCNPEALIELNYYPERHELFLGLTRQFCYMNEKGEYLMMSQAYINYRIQTCIPEKDFKDITLWNADFNHHIEHMIKYFEQNLYFQKALDYQFTQCDIGFSLI